MNERIIELADKAVEDISSGPWNISDEFCIKFAQLIVQECANEIQSLLDCNSQVDEFDQGVYNGLDMAKLCIKEHFGIEE